MQGAAQQEAASVDGSGHVEGIEQEVAARKGGSTPLGPGAMPGSAPALSEEKSLVSGMGSLVDSAPELAKVSAGGRRREVPGTLWAVTEEAVSFVPVSLQR